MKNILQYTSNYLYLLTFSGSSESHDKEICVCIKSAEKSHLKAFSYPKFLKDPILRYLINYVVQNCSIQYDSHQLCVAIYIER